MTAPERIFAQEPDIFDGMGLYYLTRGKPEDVEFIRSDLCDRDAIRAEAFEEAAKMVEFAWVRPPPIAYRLAAAIRAKAEGGNRT